MNICYYNYNKNFNKPCKAYNKTYKGKINYTCNNCLKKENINIIEICKKPVLPDIYKIYDCDKKYCIPNCCLDIKMK